MIPGLPATRRRASARRYHLGTLLLTRIATSQKHLKHARLFRKSHEHDGLQATPWKMKTFWNSTLRKRWKMCQVR